MWIVHSPEKPIKVGQHSLLDPGLLGPWTPLRVDVFKCKHCHRLLSTESPTYPLIHPTPCWRRHPFGSQSQLKLLKQMLYL